MIETLNKLKARATLNLLAVITAITIAAAFLMRIITFAQAAEAGGSLFTAMVLLYIFFTPRDEE